MKNNKLFTGVVLGIIGLLLIILKGQIISIATTFIGVVFIINGVMSIVNKDLTRGIIIIVMGAVIILFGWLFLTIALYIVGALLITYGIIDLVNKFKVQISFEDNLKKILYYLIPVLYIVAGAVLLFNQGEAISFVFVFSGVVLLVNGLLIIVDGLKEK